MYVFSLSIYIYVCVLSYCFDYILSCTVLDHPAPCYINLYHVTYFYVIVFPVLHCTILYYIKYAKYYVLSMWSTRAGVDGS